VKKYTIFWAKCFYECGTIEVEAESEVDAYEKTQKDISNLKGKMRYCPDENFIEVNGVEYRRREK